jgi:hypothetical protein
VSSLHLWFSLALLLCSCLLTITGVLILWPNFSASLPDLTALYQFLAILAVFFVAVILARTSPTARCAAAFWLNKYISAFNESRIASAFQFEFDTDEDIREFIRARTLVPHDAVFLATTCVVLIGVFVAVLEPAPKAPASTPDVLEIEATPLPEFTNGKSPPYKEEDSPSRLETPKEEEEVTEESIVLRIEQKNLTPPRELPLCLRRTPLKSAPPQIERPGDHRAKYMPRWMRSPNALSLSESTFSSSSDSF